MSRVNRVAVVALTLMLAACADTVVAPQTNPQTLSATGAVSLARYLSSAPRLAASATKTIGPEGGTLSLAGFELVIPAGAVDQATSFTIRLPSEARMAEYVSASFEPRGFQFSKPVTVRLPYVGTSAAGSDPNVVWFDGTVWIPTTTTTTTTGGSIQTQTTQLTSYGTEETDPSKGIEPVGG